MKTKKIVSRQYWEVYVPDLSYRHVIKLLTWMLHIIYTWLIKNEVFIKFVETSK